MLPGRAKFDDKVYRVYRDTWTYEEKQPDGSVRRPRPPTQSRTEGRRGRSAGWEVSAHRAPQPAVTSTVLRLVAPQPCCPDSAGCSCFGRRRGTQSSGAAAFHSSRQGRRPNPKLFSRIPPSDCRPGLPGPRVLA